ncbi:phosphotransferase family protein [Pseudohaliea sp.]|uniref:phosphotransferase family protein n=1 Tax=Pseudohaliea sp. TaxID=2740289 RepID=UPI0032ECB1C8
MSPEREAALRDWLAAVTGVSGARVAGELGGGNANVTLRLSSDDGPLVLRTPPENAVSAKAHRGIEREGKVLRALSGRARVPGFVAWCEDPAILGRPFLVVRHVDGVSITDTLPAAYPDSVETVNRLGEELVDELALVHKLPWASLGLDGFGRPEGFLERQVTRWREVRRGDQVRELPQLEALADWLLAEKPADHPGALTHGDYHLDNTLSLPDRPGLAAIIDWELATIGDPLSDLALLLMFWGDQRRADPPGFPQIQQVSRRSGVHSRRALAERWSRQTGIGLERLDYYLCFAFWRLAAIVEGAYVLFRRGKVDTTYARGIERDVPALLAEAAAAAKGDW